MPRAAAAALLALIVAIAPSSTVAAQDAAAVGERPRIGLALSGGSAKGLAHIGVIRTLEEMGVPIDVVAGTSMGALVGGLYAAGLDGAELEQVVLDIDWSAMFSDRVERRLIATDRRLLGAGVAFTFPIRGGRIGLPTGVLRGRNVMRLLQRLTWPVHTEHDFTQLRVPFAAVATDIGSGAAVVLTSGNLADALRASMALPGIFDPVRLDGRMLVDGGYVRNLPAEDARALGADVVICSDVSSAPERAEDLRTLVDVVIQTITFQMEAGAGPQRELCDVLIRPRLDDLRATQFRAADEWMARGRAAALEAADTLRALAALLDDEAPARAVNALPDTVHVGRVVMTGLPTHRAAAMARAALALPPSGPVHAAALDDAIARLYATGLFGRATYRIETTAADTIVVIDVEAQAQNELGFGLRYDDHRKASLLFTGTVRNWLRFGSSLRLGVRLGEQAQVSGLYLSRTGPGATAGWGLDASHGRAVFDLYDNGRQRAEVRATITSAGGMLGGALSRTTATVLRLGGERVDAGTSIAARDTTLRGTYVTADATILRNTFDRAAYPTRGIQLRAQSAWGDRRPFGRPSFRQYIAEVEQLVPLTPTTTLRAGATAGAVFGDDVPIHRSFFLGGVYPSAVFADAQPAFWGLAPQEHAGRAVQVFRLAVQQEVREGWFAIAGVNAGRALPEWSFRPGDYLVGWRASLGAATLLGPVELTAHGRRLDEWRLDLNIGHAF